MINQKLIILVGSLISLCIISALIINIKSDNFHIEKVSLDSNYNELYTEEEMKANGYTKVLPNYSNSDVSMCYQNIDSTKSLEIYSSSIKYLRNDGKYSLIDTRIKNVNDRWASSRGYVYRTANSDIVAYYPKLLSADEGIAIRKGDFIYTIGMEGRISGYAEYTDINNFINKNKKAIRYENVFGKDAEFRSYPTSLGANCEIVLNKKLISNKFSFKLNLNDPTVDVSLDSGGYVTMTKEIPNTRGIPTAEILGIIQVPLVKDSSAKSNNNEHFSYKNFLEIKKLGDGSYLLTATIDKKFINSPTTKYPIKALICFEQKRENQPDSAIYSGKPEINSYLSSFTVLGKSDDFGKGMIYIRYRFTEYFNLKSEEIVKANYYTYNISNNNRPTNLEMSTVSEDWCSSLLNWYNAAKTDKRTSYLKMAKPELEFNITKEAKKWCDDKDGREMLERQGVLLRQINMGSSTWNVIQSNDGVLYRNKTVVVLK